ncbi:hypothetical protein Lche_1917 [Legionella cherrii]|uniref:Uncharacterized protein n=1 Tax=Legionella cherrii TaxID=28084 RepID=A0A0W0S9W8_9GAMM|nr:hypothetical protein [Legionella cherrii]KTC79897.1 hypothetical protein Lche_1917 [Legionella cherrii]
MLYLLGEKELYYIFDGQTIKEIKNRSVETYRKRPGFFTPYENVCEFGGELIAPGFYPFCGLVLAGFSAFAFMAAAVACIGTYLIAAGADLFGATNLRNNVLELAGFALYFTGVALLTSAVGALLAIISFPHSLVSIATRSMSTLIAVSSETSGATESVSEMIAVEMNTDEECMRGYCLA